MYHPHMSEIKERMEERCVSSFIFGRIGRSAANARNVCLFRLEKCWADVLCATHSELPDDY